MAQATSIEWSDVTWGPVHGCSRVSTGCKNCYAETLSLRYGHTKAPWTARNAAENVLLKPHKLREPLSGAKAWRGLGPAAAAAGKTDGKLVFVNSMSDLFHEEIPDDYIAEVFAVMALAQRHTFQVLTKRPERMRALLGDAAMFAGAVEWAARDAGHQIEYMPWPLPNVWLGVSIENRKWVQRADVLRATPAAVRFISAEPLLGPLVRDGWAADGRGRVFDEERWWQDGYEGPDLDLADIDWLIVGGESGPGHRPMNPQWARDLRDACLAARPQCGCLTDCEACLGTGRQLGPALFVKQLGGARPGTKLEDLPEDLRIREFPIAREVARP